jgi:hypothetical protein
VPPVVIDGPDTLITGDQGRYRVRRAGNRQVMSWAVGGGAVSHAPDPAHPDELLLVADRPGSLTITVRVRDGLTERRATKAVTAKPEPPAPAPPSCCGSSCTAGPWSSWPCCSSGSPRR